MWFSTDLLECQKMYWKNFEEWSEQNSNFTSQTISSIKTANNTTFCCLPFFHLLNLHFLLTGFNHINIVQQYLLFDISSFVATKFDQSVSVFFWVHHNSNNYIILHFEMLSLKPKATFNFSPHLRVRIIISNFCIIKCGFRDSSAEL